MSGVTVVAPSPVLSVTVEAGDEIHLHAAGQGFWVARMIARLGVPVTLCCALGGETGAVLRALIERENVGLCAVTTSDANGAYLHDRRNGRDRQVIAESRAAPLRRHEADDLLGAALAQALGSGLTVLTGTQPPGLVAPAFYQGLAADLRHNGRIVIADLSGTELDAVLDTGISLVKVSDTELAADGRAVPAEAAIVEWMLRASSRGISTVVVTRGTEPTLALAHGQLISVRFPVTEAGDSRGAGDSLTAGVAATLAADGDVRDALRLGTAAGTLNAARSGLGTGRRDDISAVASQVVIEEHNEGTEPVQHTLDPDQVVDATATGRRRADEGPR